MKKEIKFANIPSVNVNKLVDTLSTSYINLIKHNVEFSKMPSVMLWGPPGVGKSQAIRQIASEIELSTNKKTKVVDVRLLLFNPIDLRGIPTSNKDKTLAIWLKPKIFDMDPSKEVVNILFLDEISSAPISVQAAAYQITLDRVVGEHRLPNNCIVIAAGNRVTDKSVAYNMPKALANRLMHFEIEDNFASWKDWANKHNINQKVMAFLSFKQDYLMTFNPDSVDEIAFATPRSWELVSNILNYIDEDIVRVYPMLAAILGNGVALEFKAYAKVFNELPNIKDIFMGKKVRVKKSPDVMYALVSAMVSYARAHKEDKSQIANSIKFLNNIPVDFALLLLHDYINFTKDYKNTLMQIPEFTHYLNSRGSLANGLI